MKGLINKPSKENKVKDLTIHKISWGRISYSSRMGRRSGVGVEMILNCKHEDTNGF